MDKTKIILISAVVLVGIGLVVLAGHSVRKSFTFQSNNVPQVASQDSAPEDNGAVLGDQDPNPGVNPVRGIYVNPFTQ